jgi:4-amino-4-deoxy-L-arabinose transferase-like glycosyltransferase
MKVKKGVLLFLILALATFLRLWKIDKVPVSLFGDELDVGYQAYSILKTGRDYNGNFMPLHFHSLAEWRTPLYLYSAVPTVAIFGISPLGVRLPAVFFGILNVLAMYLMTEKLLNYQRKEKTGSSISRNQTIALFAAFLLTISPWHIQYSRAAFEVTQLLFFYLFGIYLFFVSLEKPKYLWLSALCLILTPWIYSTAKLFTPFLIVFLSLVWFKELIKFPLKELMKGVVTFLVFGLPLVYAIFFGGGAQRFGYISVFSEPTMEGDIGFARLNDASFEGSGRSIFQKVSTRVIHNKYSYWSGKILNNYFSSFSTSFLFNTGDINRRHNIEGMGEFYKIDVIPLFLGVVLFFMLFKGSRVKYFILFWLMAGAFPSSITRDGGNHATRLILVLPPLIFLISYGLVEFSQQLSRNWKKVFIAFYSIILIFCFYLYQHNYWIHNPWYSERWWHAGFEETVKYLKVNEGKYDKIIFSNANEPPYIFFVGWYQYPPGEWQKGLKDVSIEGFSPLKNIGKYYFGQMEKIGIYDLSKYLPEGTVYVATEREVSINLIREPNRTPPGLVLLKSVAYPSGEPAFYIFKRSGT